MISELLAIALLVFGGDRLGGPDCQAGAIYFYEDASYRVETSDQAVTCNISGSPESSLSFDSVVYNDETGEIVITHWDYRVGGEFPESIEITLISVTSR